MAQPPSVSDAAHTELIPIEGAIETDVTHNALQGDTQGNDEDGMRGFCTHRALGDWRRLARSSAVWQALSSAFV